MVKQMLGEDIKLPLKNIQLTARTWGDEHASPVLALHGWLDNANSFVPLAPYLNEFRLVALDFPGHGRSQHRAPGNWSHYVDYVHDVQKVIDYFGWKTVKLLGHSMGGGIASAFSAAMPERVERLVLIEALGAMPSKLGQAPQLLRKALEQFAALESKGTRVFADKQQAIQVRQQAGELTLEASRLLCERGLKPVEGGWTWSSDSRLTVGSPYRLPESQIHELISAIKAPTLLMLSKSKNAYLGVDQMQKRIDLLENATVLRLDAGHHLHMDQASRVGEHIVQFYRS